MDDRMRSEAVVAARQLLQRFKAEHPEWADDKTPVDELVAWHGLEVARFHPDDQPQGTYGWLEPGEDLIWLCRGLPETLRRFTLAHELGHAVLHRHTGQQQPHLAEPSRNDPCQMVDVQEEVTGLLDQEQVEEILGTGQSYNPRSQRELAANIFAAELLMPLERVQSLYLTPHSPQTPPARLASIFGVSAAAMLNRLTALINEPAGAVAGEPEHLPVEQSPPSAAAKKHYDEFQQAAIEAVTPALIVAGPGSGKTSTLIGRAEYVISTLGVPPQHILALTFSRKAAQEMQERLQQALSDTPAHDIPPTVSTFHAFCAELLRTHGALVGLRRDFTLVDDAEGYFLLRRLAGELPLRHYQHLQFPTFYFPDILQAISRAKDELVTPQQYEYLARQMLEQAHDAEERQKAEKALEVAAIYARYQAALQRRGDSDFGGLILLTTQLLQQYPGVLHEQHQRYQHILVDEFQDMNRASGVLLRLLAGEEQRVWVVGDSNQCQPAGTMIRLPDGSECPIEDIQPNRNVVTYDRDSTMFVKKGQVTDVAVRHYHGMLYTVKAGDKQTRCTDSHKWLIRWTNIEQTAWVTYLMRQGNRYRVGQTQLFLKPQRGRKSNGNLSLALRVRQEKADAAWIIKVHNTLADALVYEQILAAKYGLPEVVFNQSYGVKCFTQEMIDKIYDALSPLENAARRCLEDHGRKLEYPLYTREGTNGVQNEKRQRQGRTTIFETQACNLISDFMALPVAPAYIHSKRDHSMRRVVAQSWQPIEVTNEEFSGPVYSLNIAKYHKYIADGLVTCNSIYSFRGASPANIANFKEDYPEATILPLSRNYRSRPDIVSVADAFRRQQMEPGMEQATRQVARSTQPDSYVTLATAADEASELAGLAADMRYQLAQHGYSYQDMVVLCRTRAQARKISQALTLAGLPVLERGGGSMLEQEHVRDLLSIILLLAKPGGMGMLRAARQREHALTPGDIEALLLAAREQHCTPEALIVHGEIPANISADGRRSLRRLTEILQVMSRIPDVWSMLAQYLFIETPIMRDLLSNGRGASLPPPSCQVLADYAALLQLARDYDRRQQREAEQGQHTLPLNIQEQAKEFLDYLNVMLTLRQDGASRQRVGARVGPCGCPADDSPDRIRVLTVHASKGLEFPLVYLPGLAQRRFPMQGHSSPISAPAGMLATGSEGEAAHESGEVCLFYVGVTRARDYLILSYSERYGKQKYKPSPYLDALVMGLPAERITKLRWETPASAPPLVPESPLVPVSPLVPLPLAPARGATTSLQPSEGFIDAMKPARLSISAIETYQTCPRRYAYGNIYGFQREESAYQLFWQATQKTLEALQRSLSATNGQGETEMGHAEARLPTQQEAQDLYTQHWQALGGQEFPFASIYERHGREIVQSVWSVLAAGKDASWELRRSFALEVAGTTIHVEVDRVETPAQAGQPVRFVRNRVGKSKEKPTAEVRELLYAQAYRQLFPGQTIEVHHHNLSTGELLSIKLTEKREQKLYDELEQAISGIEQHAYGATPDSFVCPTCPFYLICPA